MRFKVGDNVRVKENLVVGERYFMEKGFSSEAFSDGMRKFAGKKAVITQSAKHGYRVDLHSMYWFTDEMFDGVEEFEEAQKRQDSELADSLINHMLSLIPEQLINHALETGNKERFEELTKDWEKKE